MSTAQTAAPLELFDTHAHLDFERFDDDFDAVLGRARGAGLRGIVAIGASRGLASNQRALELAEAHAWIHATVGTHPHEAGAWTPELMAQIEAWAPRPEVVAIGETGLDYHYDFAPREVQRDVFRRFVRLACAVNKPVVIHTREADEDTIAILREEHAERCGGIIHCFSSSAWLAEQALELGFYISLSGIVTFRSAKDIQAVAAKLPAERILVETDAPYLAPTPKRGKRNEPSFVAHTLRFLAKLRGDDPAVLAAQTTANARRIFRLAEA